MSSQLKLETPHDVYDKLVRESEKLDEDFCCDHFFNFMTTAFYLAESLKKSPVSSSATVERLISKLKKDKFFNIATNLSKGKKSFSLNENGILIMDDEFYNAKDIKAELLEQFESYFRTKG
ncbi:MAG: hypothetical protein JEY94_02080 [Melioribacteraceae bacterium]|nr:hypothetical protein [Melioribacteraceae bacterium]